MNIREVAYVIRAAIVGTGGIARAHVPHFYEKTVSVMEQEGKMTFGSDFGEKEKK